MKDNNNIISKAADDEYSGAGLLCQSIFVLGRKYSSCPAKPLKSKCAGIRIRNKEDVVVLKEYRVKWWWSATESVVGSVHYQDGLDEAE